jgi:hypothetical protein
LTYILNAVALGSRATIHWNEGRLLAEPDEPTTAFLQLGSETLIGTRYLIVTQDGAGYTSSMALVSVPSDNSLSTVLVIPQSVRPSFQKLLLKLQQESPSESLAVYLEANRAISRADPEDPHPPDTTVVKSRNIEEYLHRVDRQEVAEDQIHLIEGS